MRLEEGNARDKIVEWGIRNLCSMNELGDILVLPYNEQNQ